MKTLEAALQKYDRAVPLLLVLASGTARQKNYDQTEAAYREILRMEKGNVVAMNNLAVLLALRKVKLSESLELVNRAIKTAGPLAAMLDSRASVYMALDQADKAIADLKKAVDKAPSAVNYFHLAQAYDLDGRDGEAAAAMKKAVELGLKFEMLHPLELAAYQKLQSLM